MKNFIQTMALCVILSLLVACSSKRVHVLSKVDPDYQKQLLASPKVHVELPSPALIDDKQLKAHLETVLKKKGLSLVERSEKPKMIVRFQRAVRQGNEYRFVPMLQTESVQGSVGGKRYSEVRTRWVSSPVQYSYSKTRILVALFPVDGDQVLEETVWEGVITMDSRSFQKNTQAMLQSMTQFLGKDFEGTLKLK